jgi:hypothetical protein
MCRRQAIEHVGSTSLKIIHLPIELCPTRVDRDNWSKGRGRLFSRLRLQELEMSG